MPAIIYQKTPGGLFATGERTVTTFPSGLIRVDQSFVCPTSDADTHRAALAVGEDMPGGSAPAIDGLKIFPEVQEKRRDDGFTELIVSAYGRVTTSGITRVSYVTQAIDYGNGYDIDTIKQRTVNLLYVIKGNENTIKQPLIDASVTVTREWPEPSYNLQNNNGTLINQKIYVSGAPLIFSFVGDGSVQFTGSYTGTIQGTGLNDITSVNINPIRQVEYGRPVSFFNLQVSGNVNFASLVHNYFPPVTTEIGFANLWGLKNTTVTDFGEFKEIVLNYESSYYKFY
jgi:hypothetical protein